MKCWPAFGAKSLPFLTIEKMNTFVALTRLQV
jgi:hypothetical protein